MHTHTYTFLSGCNLVSIFSHTTSRHSVFTWTRNVELVECCSAKHWVRNITATGRYNHKWFTELLHNNRFMALCPGLPRWAGSRRNIHPVYSWSSSNLYQLLPSTTIHSILPVQFTCLTILLHNLCLSPLWSTSWSGALHLVLHTFLYPIWSMKWNCELIYGTEWMNGMKCMISFMEDYEKY